MQSPNLNGLFWWIYIIEVLESTMKMKYEFLRILESFMHDKEYKLPEDFENPPELFQLSQQHHMTAAVYEQIRTSEIWNKPEYTNLLIAWKRSAIREVMVQMQKTEGFLVLYEKLTAAGITPLVVKGVICRSLYSKPDYRISGDEDILLPQEQFAECDKILLQEGFQREKIDMEHLPYEIPYFNNQNGVYIELHFSLFPEESGAYGHLNEEFKDVFSNKVCEMIQGTQVWTLCPTEHLFYLICHSFKHFLHSGFGLRQVCDMVMMAERYGNKMDWEDITLRLERLNMKMYWDALTKIGEEYLEFDFEKAAYLEFMQNRTIDIEPLLNDLLESGIYGDSSMERKHSSNMTLAAVEGGKASTAASLKASLFPGMEYMKRNFQWLEKHSWLLPAAYLIRIFRYLKGPKGKIDEKNSVEIGMERVELLRMYRIIK